MTERANWQVDKLSHDKEISEQMSRKTCKLCMLVGNATSWQESSAQDNRFRTIRTCFLQRRSCSLSLQMACPCPCPCPALTLPQRAAEEEAYEGVLHAVLRHGSLKCSALMAASPLSPPAAPWNASCVPAVQGTPFSRPGREQAATT